MNDDSDPTYVLGMSVEPEFGATQPIMIYFDQLDAFRTLYHVEYVRTVDRALAAYWEAKGYHGDGELNQPDTIPLVREITIKFDQPIRDYGRFLLHLWIDRIGKTSYVVGFRILSSDGTTQYAHGSRVEVKVNPRTMRPSPIMGRSLKDLEELLRHVPPEV